jgi:predicted transcriptional regulator
MGKLVEDRRVKDLMTHGVIMVPEEATVIDVVGILVEGNVHGVIVTDESNEPCGVVSEIDIPKGFGKDFTKTPITQIMSRTIFTIGMDERIEKAGEIMMDKSILRLIVVDEEGRMYGILTLRDIVTEIYDIFTSRKE